MYEKGNLNVFGHEAYKLLIIVCINHNAYFNHKNDEQYFQLNYGVIWHFSIKELEINS